MLNHFHHTGAVKPFKSLVPVNEGTLKNRQLILQRLRHPIGFQPIPGSLQHTKGNIRGRYPSKLLFFEQKPQQVSFATAHIDHRSSAAGLCLFQNRAKTDLIKILFFLLFLFFLLLYFL